jgi:hypothetical protein
MLDMTPQEEIRGNGSRSKVLDLSGHIKHRQELHYNTHVSVTSYEEGLHPVRKEQ